MKKALKWTALVLVLMFCFTGFAWAAELSGTAEDYCVIVQNEASDFTSLGVILDDPAYGRTVYVLNTTDEDHDPPETVSIRHYNSKIKSEGTLFETSKNFVSYKAPDLAASDNSVLTVRKTVKGERVRVYSMSLDDSKLVLNQYDCTVDSLKQSFNDGTANINLAVDNPEYARELYKKSVVDFVIGEDGLCLGILRGFSDETAVLYTTIYDSDVFLSGDSSITLTEAPTDAPTEAATEEPTEEETEAPTEAATEAVVEDVTEVVTEEMTDAPTEAPAEKKSSPLPIILGVLVVAGAVVTFLLLKPKKKNGNGGGYNGNQNNQYGGGNQYGNGGYNANQNNQYGGGNQFGNGGYNANQNNQYGGGNQFGNSGNQNNQYGGGNQYNMGNQNMGYNGGQAQNYGETVPVNQGEAAGFAPAGGQRSLVLVCGSGRLEGFGYPIQGVVTIGKEAGCTVKYPGDEPLIAPWHATLKMEYDMLTITDTSGGGIWLERMQMRLPEQQPIQLYDGDVFYLGGPNTNRFEIVKMG